jgi:hypothetical protein
MIFILKTVKTVVSSFQINQIKNSYEKSIYCYNIIFWNIKKPRSRQLQLPPKSQSFYRKSKPQLFWL